MATLSPKTAAILQAILFLAVVGVLAYAYPLLPDPMASHWNAAGEVDGYMPKFWGAVIGPLIILGIWMLSLGLRFIDPLRKNLESFRGAYDFFFVALNLFLAYVFTLSIAWNLGERFDVGQMISPALAALMWSIALLLEHSKRNWFVGIRTPWTMQSDAVWEKTHALGGILFKLTACSILLGAIFPAYLLWFAFVPIVLTVVATITYSYIEFRREVR